MAKDKPGKAVEKAARKTKHAIESKVDAVKDKTSAAESSSTGGKKKSKDSSKVWSILSIVAGVGASQVAKRVLTTSWKASTGRKPPENPADPDVEMIEAVLWAAASGTLVAVARMLATRHAAKYYHRSTGHLPPGLQKDGE